MKDSSGLHYFRDKKGDITWEMENKVMCPICGIKRDMDQIYSYRWAIKTEKTKFWDGLYHPRLDITVMWFLPEKRELPICTNRKLCEKRRIGS